MKKYRLLTSAILLFLLCAGNQPVFGLTDESGGNKQEIEELNEKINAKKEKIKQLEKSIDEFKEKIRQKRLEAVSLSNQMAILDNRTVQVELDIEITEEKLSSLTLEIEALELSITEKERVIEKQKTMLAELLRTLYKEDGKTYIEIAAAYSNFSEFFNQLQYLETVQKDLGANVRGLRTIKSELEAKKRQTEERKTSYESLAEKLKEKRKDLEEQLFAKQNLLAQTQMSELKFNTLLGNLKQQYQSIENEITSIEQEVRQRLEEESLLDESVVESAEFSWPTQSRYVTAYFHDPEYPFRHIFEHTGIDIRAGQGTPVKATASGYVARAKLCSVSSCYSYIMLVHTSGMATVYGHMSQITVKEDQFVTRGDVIGLSGGMPGTVGAGPFVTGPHLHFEIRKNGIPVNPLDYLVRDW